MTYRIIRHVMACTVFAFIAITPWVIVADAMMQGGQ